MSIQITPEGSECPSPIPKKTLEVQTFMHGFAVTAGPQKYFFPYKTILYCNIGRKEDMYILSLKTDGGGTINLSSSFPLEEEFAQICRHFN